MGLQRRCFVSPSRLGLFAETKECAEVEQRREVFLGAETGRDSHSTFRRPPPGFQWPRDMATMALLVRARTGEKSIECAGKDVIRERGWSSEGLVKLGSTLSSRPDWEVGDARDVDD
jgi:hypothetical protein